MYNIKINQNTYGVVPQNGENHEGTVNGTAYHLDMTQKDASNWVVNKDGKEYRIEVANLDTDNKVAIIRINGRKYSLKLQDQFDQLLKDLGLEGMAVKKISEIKSPMPGLVLDILVQPGDSLKKGDQVLVLEAMKMENILRAEKKGIVAKINAAAGDSLAVDAIIMEFE